MLSTYEIALYALVVVLLPIVAFSLLKGSPPPQIGLLAKYYRAEKHLNLVGNLFLLTVCANALARLGLHFGFIDPGAQSRLMFGIGLPFVVLLLAFLALWVRAFLKVRRLDAGSA